MISVNDVANILDGRAYPLVVEFDLWDQMFDGGIVVVYGGGDDLIEFDGAICDEASVHGSGEVFFDRHGLLGDRPDDGTDEDLRAWLDRKARAKCIKAVVSDDGPAPCWTYETDIPHRVFDVIEDGNVYCTGIVFSVADL